MEHRGDGARGRRGLEVGGDDAADLARCGTALRELGHPAAYVDLTTPDIELVRVPPGPGERGRPAAHPLRGLDGERPVVELPPPGESPLTALLTARRSARAFALGPLPLAAVSALAAAAQGVVEIASIGEGNTVVRRAAPSAGGLYPLNLHAFVRRVDGLPDGLYRYDPFGHALEPAREGDPAAELAPALYAWPFVEGANLVLALVGRFHRTQRKYGPRDYRHLLLEAGHAVQNMCPQAVELGLTTLCVGGFIDSPLNPLLGLEPAEAGAVYVVAAGHPA